MPTNGEQEIITKGKEHLTQTDALLVLIEYLKLAQSKGAYTLEDSVMIMKCINIFKNEKNE